MVLATTEPQVAVMNCARDFEEFLSIMRYNLSLSIPAKHGDQYTIGEMKDGFFHWLKKNQIEHPNPQYGVELKQLQQTLDQHLILRNVAGAHYNEWASNLTSEEAKDFITVVKKLTALFKCPTCQRHWVEFNNATKQLYCKYCSDKQKPDAPLWLAKKG